MRQGLKTVGRRTLWRQFVAPKASAGLLLLSTFFYAATLSVTAFEKCHVQPFRTARASEGEIEKKVAIKHYVHGIDDYQKSKVNRLYQSGCALMRGKKYGQARKVFDEAISAHDSPHERILYKSVDMCNYVQSKNYYQRGKCNYELKDYSEALNDLTEAINLSPQYSLPYKLRARVFQALKMKQRSFSDIAKASSLTEYPPFLGIERPTLESIANESPQARAEHDAFFAAFYAGGRKDWEASEMENWYWRGRRLMDDGSFAAAIGCFTQAIKSFSQPKEKTRYKVKAMADYKLGWNYKNRAYCHLMLKDYEKAISDLTTAIRLEPTYQENYINRAKALQKLGRSEEARLDFEKASTMKPGQLPPFLQKRKVNQVP